MRINNPPSGLANHRLPIVWQARHPDGCYLFIERLGPTCAVVWRVAPHRWADWLEDMVFGDSTDYAVNLEAAESHALMLMALEAPEQMKPSVARASQRERRLIEMADKGVAEVRVGRPRKTEEEKRIATAERQQRYRDRLKGQHVAEVLPKQWMEDFSQAYCDLTREEQEPVRIRIVRAGSFGVEEVAAWGQGLPAGQRVDAWLLTEAARSALADVVAAMQKRHS